MGIGVALAMGNIPTYIGETSEARVRGTLGSLLTLTYTCGITACYIVGGFLGYRAAAVMMLGSAVLSTVLFAIAPETPAWLVKKGKIQVYSGFPYYSDNLLIPIVEESCWWLQMKCDAEVIQLVFLVQLRRAIGELMKGYSPI